MSAGTAKPAQTRTANALLPSSLRFIAPPDRSVPSAALLGKSRMVCEGYNLCKLPMQPNGAKVDTVLQAMERILVSPGFARNERLSGFLRFIVQQKLQGNTTALKETVIGTEVFGRKPDYDTHAD